MKKILGALAAGAVLAAQAVAQPVGGRMTIHDNPVGLKHAVAQPYSRAGGAPTAYLVALTDRPLPEGALDGPEAAGIRLLAVWRAASTQVRRMEKATVKTVKAMNAGFEPLSRAQNEVALQHFFDEKFFAESSRRKATLELRDILDKSTRLIERGRWATIVPADPGDTPIELVQDEQGGWRLGQ